MPWARSRRPRGPSSPRSAPESSASPLGTLRRRQGRSTSPGGGTSGRKRASFSFMAPAADRTVTAAADRAAVCFFVGDPFE